MPQQKEIKKLVINRNNKNKPIQKPIQKTIQK